MVLLIRLIVPAESSCRFTGLVCAKKGRLFTGRACFCACFSGARRLGFLGRPEGKIHEKEKRKAHGQAADEHSHKRRNGERKPAKQSVPETVDSGAYDDGQERFYCPVHDMEGKSGIPVYEEQGQEGRQKLAGQDAPQVSRDAEAGNRQEGEGKLEDVAARV